MKKHIQIILLAIILISSKLFSQAAAPSCPTNSIHAHNGSSIAGHSLPNGPLTNVLNNMPAGSGGLAVGPAFNFPAPNPTWWTTAGNPKTYWYYNNTGGWTSSGHAVTNNAAVNVGGGGSRVYNLVGAGQVYAYNGTGPDVFVTTLVPAFNGGGPYDIVADMANNFFILKASTPGQGLYVYNPQGVLQCSFAAVGMISQTAGGGFAILNTANPNVHRVYYNSNGTDYIGDVIPGNTTINFTVQPLPNGSDYASCALTIPEGTITAPQGGTLTCTLPSIPLVAGVLGNNSFGWGLGYNTTNTNTPVTPTCGGITWEGPGPNNTAGIVSGQGTPTIIVNQPGVYSFTWTGCGGCPGYSVTASYTVVGQGASFNPIINAPTCIGSPTQISVSPNSSTNTILWTGPGIQGPNNTPTITINAPGIYTVSLSIPNSACAGIATVQIFQTPTVSIVASSNSMCLNNFNGSLNSVTLTASGAGNYTWTNISGMTNTSPTNTSSTITFTPDANSQLGNVTLIGSNGVCSNALDFSVAIIPNPVVAVASASVCAGNSVALIASGASSYTWSPSSGLNTTNGPTVIASPANTNIYSVIGTSLGCNSATQNATVSVSPLPVLNVGPITNTICQGGFLNLVANGATNYTWSPASSLNMNTGPSVVASPANTTNYTVIGELNTCTASAVYQVSVIVMPSIQITTSADTICQNSSVILTANGASSYTWAPANLLNTPFGSQVISQPSSTTVFSVSGANGVCLAYGTVTITVVPFPNLIINTPNWQICQTNSTSIYANGASNYIWSPANGLSNTNTSVVQASPMESTNYTITGFNTLGNVTCSSTKEILIGVVPQVTASISGSVEICEGMNVKLTAGGGNTYSWSPSDRINDPTIYNPMVNPKVTTIYSVIVSNNSNCPNVATVLVKVNPTPTLNAGEDFTANLDEEMHLNAVGNGTITWLSGDGIQCSPCPKTQILPKKSGCYLAESVNEFGCKTRDEVCITVTTEYNIYIPNVFTPNDDGNNDVFTVYGTGLSNIEILVFDRWGEKLFASKDQKIGWDGHFKGELCKSDVYPYQIKYTTLDGKNHVKTGHVTLLK